MAPWSRAPCRFSKYKEKTIVAMDDTIKKDTLKEYGYFLDGMSRYMISEAEATDIYRTSGMFFPYYEREMHEVIPTRSARKS